MSVSTKQKQTHRHGEQACGCQEWGWEREGLGVWGQKQASIYRMDKQHCPTAQHRELYSVSSDKP